MSRMRVLFLGGTIAVILATITSWLLISESSPLSEYLLWHPQIRNYWATLNFPAHLAGALAKGNPHGADTFIFWTIFLAQWFLTGIILTIIARTLFRQPIA